MSQKLGDGRVVLFVNDDVDDDTTSLHERKIHRFIAEGYAMQENTRKVMPRKLLLIS